VVDRRRSPGASTWITFTSTVWTSRSTTARRDRRRRRRRGDVPFVGRTTIVLGRTGTDAPSEPAHEDHAKTGVHDLTTSHDVVATVCVDPHHWSGGCSGSETRDADSSVSRSEPRARFSDLRRQLGLGAALSVNLLRIEDCGLRIADCGPDRGTEFSIRTHSALRTSHSARRTSALRTSIHTRSTSRPSRRRLIIGVLQLQLQMPRPCVAAYSRRASESIVRP